MKRFFLIWSAAICAGVGAGFQLHAQSLLYLPDSTYLYKHDIVYKTPAYEGFEGFPLGNGDLGGMLWNTPRGVELQINKSDLFDQKHEENRATLRGGVRLNIDLGAPGFDWMFLSDYKGRLSLADAQAGFMASTPFSENKITSWVAQGKNVWCIEVSNENKAGLAAGTQMRVGIERWGSRAFPGWYGYFSKDAASGLGQTQTQLAGNDIVLQDAWEGLSFSVACRVVGVPVKPAVISAHSAELASVQQAKAHRFYVIVAMVTSHEAPNTTTAAIELLDDFEKQTIDKERASHAQWWRSFWARSFVQLGDDYLENLYYLRRYLMASASRGRFPVVFNGGLWTWNHDVRNWVTPHHWNTQQQYWGLCAQNDTELMLPYLNTYFRLIPQAMQHAKLRGADSAILWAEPHDFFGSMTFWDRDDMLNNFTPASQIAGLFREYFEYTADTGFLREKAYPFMKMAAEFYLKKLQWDSIKKEYFIFPAQPYENPRTNQLKNPITDRNVILANFSFLIKAAKMLQIDAPKIKQWQHVIDHMWPVPYRTVAGVGEVAEQAWDKSDSIFPSLKERGPWQSHMSAHTSGVFPAGLVGMANADSREFKAMVNVINNRPEQFNAISPEPIVAARLGMGNAVLRMMRQGTRRLQHFPQGLFYNIDHWYNLSRYMDSIKRPDLFAQRDYIYDERSKYPNGLPAKPFIQAGLETQSIYGAAVNEMLLQSHEGFIRVFPAVPEGWPCSFTLLARGGFLVSASRSKDAAITALHIKSQQGNTCRLYNPWPGKKVVIRLTGLADKKLPYKTEANGVVSFSIPAGAACFVYPENQQAPQVKMLQGIRNEAPKFYEEATLGKERNF